VVRYVVKEYMMIWYLCWDSGLVVWEWPCGWRLCKVYFIYGSMDGQQRLQAGVLEEHNGTTYLPCFCKYMA